MAYTVAVTEKFNAGPHRVHVLSITADAATQNVDSGLDYVRFFQIGLKSATTAGIKIYPNSGAEGTALAGILGISGAVSGDVFYVTCYGR